MVSMKRRLAAKKAVRTKKKKYGNDMVSPKGAVLKRIKLRRAHR